jgi:hypothetical protein
VAILSASGCLDVAGTEPLLCSRHSLQRSLHLRVRVAVAHDYHIRRTARPTSGNRAVPITVSGVTFTNNEARLFTGSGYLWNFDSSYPVGVFLPNGSDAFGADFSGGINPQNNPFNGTLTFTLLDGQTFTHNFTGQVGSSTFLGFTFSQPIRNLVYSDGGSFLPGAHEEKLDNVTFGVVPEPQTSLLVVIGVLTSFGVLRWRKQKQRLTCIRGLVMRFSEPGRSF